MADELRIKIILDDGSVKEGFVSAEKQAEKSAQKIGKSFDKKGSGLQSVADGAEAAAGGITSMAQAAIRAAGPVGAIVAAIGAAALGYAKMALAGEQVNAVNTQFTNIATSAGLAADQFGQSIISATQGLIDDEDALQIATKGIIALGDQASKLPAILDASRSVSRALGKDFKATFEDLSTFVENGNARILRQFGIVLDLEKAYEKAAKSIGVATSALTEQQKQQVRANLILDEVPKKFSSAAESVTPLKDAFDRLKVSASNSLESIQSSFANFITKKFVDETDLSNVATSRLRNNLSDVSKEIATISSRIEEIKLDKLGSKSVQASAEVGALNTELKKLRDEQQKLFIEQSARSDQELFSALDASKAAASGGETIKATKEQLALIAAERIKKEEEYTAFLLSEQAKRINNTIQIKQLELANETSLDQQKVLNKQILDQQLLLQENSNQVALGGIKKQFAGTELIDVQNKNAAIELSTQTHKDNLLLIEKKSAADKAAIEKRTAQTQLSNLQSSFATIATLQESSSKELAAIGKAAAISNATIDGYAAVQKALASAPPPFNFAIAAIVGVAAAANVAKIAGVGGGGGAPSFSPDSGGGIASSPSTSTDLTQPQDLQRAEATTGVSVVIQGDVLDSDESGSRIVNLINSAFDKKGVVINQGVMA